MSSEYDNQLDSILHALGPTGKFTILQLTLVWFSHLPTAFQLLSNVFIGPMVPHRCGPPANETEYLRPFQRDHSNVSVVYDQCAIRVLAHNKTIHADTCVFGMDYDLPIDTSFVSQFDLVCDATNLGRLTQTLVIGGQGCGAVLGALMADKLGRRPVIIVSNLGIMVAGLIIAYAPSFFVFALFKFIAGAFQQAMVAVHSTITLELLVIKDRRLSSTLCGLFWASGVIGLSLIAFLLKGYSWRTVQMALSVVSLLVVIQFVFLKESLRWLMANGKTKEVIQYIKYAAKMNGKDWHGILNDLNIVTTSKVISEKPVKGETPDISVELINMPVACKKLSYLDIFRIPRLLRNTVIMWIAWFTTAFGFFAIYLTATTLAGDRYLNFFLTALMEVPSNIFFYFGLNRYGRKVVMMWVFMTLSVGLMASGVFRSLEQTPINSTFAIASSMLAMAGASGCFGMSFAYTPELFPTNIRNQALGISSMVARIGGMLAPFTGVLSEKAKWGPGLLIGCLASLVAISLRFLPETNGRELPQTIEELQLWYKDNNNEEDGKDEEKVKEMSEPA